MGPVWDFILFFLFLLVIVLIVPDFYGLIGKV